MKNKLQKLKDFIEQDDNLNTNIGYGLVDQAIAEVVADVDSFLTVANVEFDPSGISAVLIGETVELSTTTADAQIYYTLDASTPDNTDILYTEPILIEDDVTIKATAYKDYQEKALVQTGTFSIDLVATPAVSTPAGEVALNTEITLTSATSGAAIYFTTNGDAPTDEDTLYTTPIVIDEAMTIKAIAYKANYKPSLVRTAAYTIAA